MKRLAVLILSLLGPRLAWASTPEVAANPRQNLAAPARSHWAFVPPASIIPPGVGGGVAANPIDAFILAKLREKKIEPVDGASRPELLRRVTYDLTGLPPTPSELKEFLEDSSSSAYEKVVDRLLASPSFGERWAQHWLDLAHYADSNGFELDLDRPDAWRYRDWVVRALNEDVPYDRFLTLQLAGDEAAPGSQEALIASGFARCGPFEIVSGNIDPEVRRQNELMGVTSTVGSVFLGLTLGCARCHDHKFDPLPTTDYYRLQAFFAGTQFNDVPIHAEGEKATEKQGTARIEALVQPLQAAKAELEKPYRERLQRLREAGLTLEERAVRDKPMEQRTPEEVRLFEGTSVALNLTWEAVAEAVSQNPVDFAAREALKRQISELQRRLPKPLAHAMSMTEGTNGIPETRVLRRGDLKNPQAVVDPAPPTVLRGAMTVGDVFESPVVPLDSTHSGRRLALARWFVATNNPLTARVMVNRLWQHHFGQGLVATPSDFGTRGALPSHQELLDWLAQELIRTGWRLKPMHRLMVTSQAYRRSSRNLDASGRSSDPGNRYWGRRNRRRMEAEGLRDSMLAVAGLLNQRIGGPGVHIPLEPEVESLIFTEAEVVELWPVERDVAEQGRRSIYVHRKRNVHYPLFDAFDAPDALTSCPERPVSTHAPQALVLLNSGFAQQTAGAFARLLLRHSSEDQARIEEAFLRCYARPPTPEEGKRTREFVRADARPELDRWTDLTLALLNSNEFVYVP